jgi:glycosyltransferase involved in cell wall biosynthesis
MVGINRTESIEELAKWYSLATVFVNPTTQDNFPTTNIEALACGTPVITYNTGGSPEAIDENTGRIVDKNDVDSLKEKILEFIQYDMSILSEHCRKRALAYYDKDKRYMDYLNICEKMILKNN